ncbi:MAG: DUF1071 domain-containing protein [Proteobacteria bacterium]|jgi:hypothetical protein|nr:DUF1071 domain-containing protein [Pseudomonadota bacterium]
MKETKELTKFETLLQLNVNGKVEKKKSGNTELTYLSWAFAVAEMEKAYPDWEYNILEFNGSPYQFDEKTGYMVWTEIKAGGKTKKMWLPVMDGANKAMSNVKQEYSVKGYNGAPPVKKFVEPATMFDINKTIMRCLVKNIAMFGIGLYIYAGEDLPEDGENKASEAPKQQKQPIKDLPKIEEFISAEQGIELENLAKQAGVDICKAYKIDKIIDLPFSKFEKCKNALIVKIKAEEFRKAKEGE